VTSIREPIKSWLTEALAWIRFFDKAELTDHVFTDAAESRDSSLRAIGVRVATLLGQVDDAYQAMIKLGLENDESEIPAYARAISQKNLGWHTHAYEGLREQAELLEQSEAFTFPDLFYATADARRLVAASRFLGIKDGQIFENFFAKLKRRTAELPFELGIDYRRSVRRVLSNFYLYPFLDLVENSSYRYIYSLAFDNEGEVMMFHREVVERLLGSVDRELADTIFSVLRNISELASVDEERLEDLIASGANLGRGAGEVLVIPGSRQAQCRRILLVLCNSKSSRLKPKAVFEQLQIVMAKCADTIQAVILVSDVKAMAKAFDEVLPVLEAQIKSPTFALQGFIPIVNSRGRLSVIEWR